MPEAATWHEADGVIDFAREVLERPLDAAQELIARGSMGRAADGYWAARHVGVCMPRQNGKTYWLALRALYGVIVLGEELVVHTAQTMAIASEQQRFIDELVATTPALKAEHVRADYGAGRECHEFATGRILFKARNRAGGQNFRGPSVACVIFDEAAFLTEDDASAALYAASAKPHAQFWYAGTAPDAATMTNSKAWARVRDAGLRGEPRRAWFMWRAYDCEPSEVTDDMKADSEAWARANPALGRRIRIEDVKDELAADPQGFPRERLGVGDWPRIDGADTVIPLEAWDACADTESQIDGRVWLAFDVDPERLRATVAAGGKREDDLPHVEIIEHFRNGIAGLADYLVKTYRKHMPVAVFCDSTSPAASLVPELVAAGLRVETTSTAEFARACGMLFDAVVPDADAGISVDRGTVRHRGPEIVREAIRVAAKRPLVDAWAWSRKNSTADISPLVAITLALWAVTTHQPPLPAHLMFPRFDAAGNLITPE